MPVKIQECPADESTFSEEDNKVLSELINIFRQKNQVEETIQRTEAAIREGMELAQEAAESYPGQEFLVQMGKKNLKILKEALAELQRKEEELLSTSSKEVGHQYKDMVGSRNLIKEIFKN